MEEIKDDVERVISRSRVWPELWVGKVICWVRLKVLSRSKKEETCGAAGSSTCRLKSPVKISSDEVEIKSSRREVNSDKKVALEEDGGR